MTRGLMIRLPLWGVFLYVACGGRELAPLANSAEIAADSVILTVDEQVEVSVFEAGILGKLSVREGSRVEIGQELGMIDDRADRILYEQARIEHASAVEMAANDLKVQLAKKVLDQAKNELTRVEEAESQLAKSISATELSRYRLAYERSQIELHQAEFELRTADAQRSLAEQKLAAAKLKLDRRKILSPVPGIVVQIDRHVGEWIVPERALLRIVRIDRLRAEGFLNIRDTSPEVLGLPATVSVTLPDGTSLTTSGKITFVSPEIEPVDGRYRIWAQIENPQARFRPGMNAVMKIRTTDGKPAPAK